MTARDPFLLDPEIVYLNHGAFGACPRPVFDVYQEWQRELEREPVELFERRLRHELARVREALGAYVGAPANDLALVLNATAGMNAVLRSLPLAAGDEILTTEHEYGAIELLLAFVAERTGARVVRASGVDADAIWAAATPRTRVLVASHVTSPTALVLPVEELCRRAREADVLSVVDGAHGPGQVPLDLERLGADFYAGNCHKWLCAPKGAGFLYARPERQPLVQPLVIGWGYDESAFALSHDWESTRDPAAYLAVPAAIEFVRAHGRGEECREVLRRGSAVLATPASSRWRRSSRCRWRRSGFPRAIRRRCSGDCSTSSGSRCPCAPGTARHLVRVSVAPYNEPSDLDLLANALERLVPAR